MEIAARVSALKEQVDKQEKEYNKASALAELLSDELEQLKDKLAQKYEVRTSEEAKALLEKLTAEVEAELEDLENKLA